jgi:hypothetical protein
VLGYGLDDRGSRVLFTTASRTVLGPIHPPIQWVTGAFSLGVKRPGREADHSPHLRTGRLERELQMVQLSVTRYSCIAILLVSLVSFAAITLYVASQRVFIVVSVYFVIDSVWKLLDMPSYDKVQCNKLGQLNTSVPGGDVTVMYI